MGNSPESSCIDRARSVAKRVYRIPNYIPSLSKWLPRINAALINCLWKDPVKSILVRDVEDLMQVMYQAQKKNKIVKYVGGSYPINNKNCDYVISAREMKSIVAFNPDKAWITVEGGAKLGDVLLFLRDRGCTLEMYGSVPDFATADALAVGSSGSNGSISLVVQCCEVVLPKGFLCHVKWPIEDTQVFDTFSEYTLRVIENISEAGDIQPVSAEALSECSRLSPPLCCNRFARPSLDAIICGLGLFGAVGLCTFKCIDLHLAYEDTQVLTLREMIHQRHNFTSCLYVKIRCFPLLGKFLVTKAISVPPCKADWQPVWKMLLEKALITAYNVVAKISPLISLVYPNSSATLSAYQFHLLSWALIMRRHCCFWPQKIVPASSVYKGEEYVLPDSHINVALRGMLAWADRNRHFASKPFKLSLRTLKGSKTSAPILLAPTDHSHVWCLWTDYFNGVLPKWRKSSAASEFVAIMSRAMATRSWSAAPVTITQHPHPGIARIQALRSQLGCGNTFRSAYIQDDLQLLRPDDVKTASCVASVPFHTGK